MVLRSQNLSFQYEINSPTLVFEDVSIEHGQHTLLLGDSGSGKTTLLHLLSGLSKPATGQDFIGEQRIYELSDSKLDTFRAQNIGFIFQEAHLLKNLTIFENIQLAQHLAHAHSDKNQILALLDKLQLSNQARSYPQKVSRGQLQRAAIARAIVNKPKLLIADEPTASLDDKNTARVLELLLDTASKHAATLLIATHDKRIKDHFSNTYHL
jgi:putative ABC transport system ATP-binding protein